jgi:hypothetical protein
MSDYLPCISCWRILRKGEHTFCPAPKGYAIGTICDGIPQCIMLRGLPQKTLGPHGCIQGGPGCHFAARLHHSQILALEAVAQPGNRAHILGLPGSDQDH